MPPPPWYSARWWLTLMCGFVFIFAVLMRLLPTEAVVAILMLVFQSYFMRSDRPQNGVAPDGAASGEVGK